MQVTTVNKNRYVGKISVDKLYALLLKLYLVSILYLYPYGIMFGADASLRLSDMIAIPCTALGVALLLSKQRLSKASVCLLPVVPLVAMEIFLPIIGGLFAGGGMGGIVNGVRMVLLWAPMLLFVALLGHRLYPAFHESFRNILIVAICVNLIYGIMQIFARFGFIPRSIIFTTFLEPFAVDDHFRVFDGFRASGFFVNTTGLAVLATCALAYFLGNHYQQRKNSDILMALMCCVTIVLTLSRASFAAMALMLFLYVLFLRNALAIKFLTLFTVLSGMALLLVNHFIGFDVVFARLEIFMALGATGALEDTSFQSRIYRTWPRTMAYLENYPLGTFVSPGALFSTIDSGYLTYYAQGKWPFVLAFFVLLLASFTAGVRTFFYKRNGGRLSLFFLGLFLAGAMVISIPIRAPGLVFILTYLLWQSWTHLPLPRQSREQVL